jgi:mannose-6-phosphate isomerase-like protein (cupin superfamily)
VDVRNITQVPAFITKDGSEIREILAYRNSCIRHQSLAEARLPVGGVITPHHHPKSEEIYYILEGRGQMTVGSETREVGPGEAIAIPPGEVHKIATLGDEPLKFLCCCAPAYEHEDTVLLGKEEG